MVYFQQKQVIIYIISTVLYAYRVSKGYISNQRAWMWIDNMKRSMKSKHRDIRQ